MSKITTSQTIGPFSHEAWHWAVDGTASVHGSAPVVTIAGVIYDGNGAPINDAMIEAWLPDAAEAEAGAAIPAFRRVPSGEDGRFSLRLSLPAPATRGAPVAYITVFARGLVRHQFTAVFLDDDSGLADSPILKQVPAARRASLIARKSAAGQYDWDIWMQSERETVFFDYA